nr:MAG: hypothetical protein [Bacteriophage sp.]
MKNRSWSDEFEELILQYSGSCKDPPEERKSKIKKLIREELNKNPVLSNVLRENKVEGKFIKEYTDKIIRYSWSDRAVRENICYNINSERPIDLAFTWRNTKQGHEYWRKINDLVINELSK